MDERYRQLAGKVDAFFARVEARHGDEMQCRAGCHECCKASLTVTAVEADAVAEAAAALDDDGRARLARAIERAEGRAGAGPATQESGAPGARPPIARCAALDDDGRCLVYAGRPLVCRSHGVPVRQGELIDACRLNFAKRGPAAADRDCVLDQTTLSATLLAVDRAAGGDGSRVALIDVLREAL